uniref:Uncharacterized protein n=1 Tax=Arundo donax TaxID=35708 RepID=A0A0A8ZHJ0_ARUDO
MDVYFGSEGVQKDGMYPDKTIMTFE